MKIAMIGSGKVGSALGKSWAMAGHAVMFGTRDPHSSKIQELLKTIGPQGGAGEISEAAAWGEVLLLATPWAATLTAIEAAGSLDGKILIDATNPIAPDGKLAVGYTTSGGERVASWAKGARVVKAFNCVGSASMANADYGGQKPALFLCGDEVAAKQIVLHLAEDIGFEAVDCGPLWVARYLEPAAMLWIQLAYRQGLGPNMAFALLKR